MYVSVLPLWLCASVWAVTSETWKAIKSPGTGAADGCEEPCGGWKQNPDPLREQTALNLQDICLFYVTKTPLAIQETNVI